jgi:hypothetical protein
MSTLVALLYLAAIVLLMVAGFRPPVRVSLVCFAGACALLAFSLLSIRAGLGG